MDRIPDTTIDQAEDQLAASVQIISLPAGIYALTVRSGGANTREPGRLVLPAVQISLAPAPCDGTVEFVMAPSTLDRWLAFSDDVVMVRIAGGSASLLLTSLRPPSGPVMAIDLKRLDTTGAAATVEDDAAAALTRRAVDGPPGSGSAGSQDGELVPTLLAHLQDLGEVEYNDGRAGAAAGNLWIEAFAISSLEPLGADQIEYRGLTIDGAETPWLSDRALCGSRDRQAPLGGFAARLKPEIAERHVCQYSGTFLSAGRVGPCRDGLLCRSALPGDPLTGIEIRILERPAVVKRLPPLVMRRLAAPG